MKETIDEETRKKIMEDLIDFTKMKKLLRTRGNLLAPGLDGITNPLLKLEREKCAKMFVELMKMIINTGFCPEECVWECKNNFTIQRRRKRQSRKSETNNSYKRNI
jgi:hypothetical protein